MLEARRRKHSPSVLCWSLPPILAIHHRRRSGSSSGSASLPPQLPSVTRPSILLDLFHATLQFFIVNSIPSLVLMLSPPALLAAQRLPPARLPFFKSFTHVFAAMVFLLVSAHTRSTRDYAGTADAADSHLDCRCIQRSTLRLLQLHPDIGLAARPFGCCDVAAAAASAGSPVPRPCAHLQVIHSCPLPPIFHHVTRHVRRNRCSSMQCSAPIAMQNRTPIR